MKPSAHEPEFSAQPVAPGETTSASSGSLTPDIVSNIQVHDEAGQPKSEAHPPAASDDMDKIMQDVGKQMKKADKKPAKRHLFSKKPKAQTPAAPKLAAARPVPAAHPAAKAAAAKPKPANKPKPVLAIVLTILVTAALIAAAISAYKQ